MKPEILYIYHGHVERGTGNGYVWRDGYSEALDGLVLYPWMTKDECLNDARARRSKARFAKGEA